MIAQSELKTLLHYDSHTGIFTRIKPGHGVRVGDVAGCARRDGYREIRVKGRAYLAHRLAWLYVHGAFPDGEIDHINHDRGDNRLANLRVVTRAENCRNASRYKCNTSGHAGINWNGRDKKWQAYINLSGKRRSLGYFANKNEAIAARKEAEADLDFHPNHGAARSAA